MTIQGVGGWVGIVVVAGVAGCATFTRRAVVRGVILGRSVEARVIVSGPVTLHAYAAFAGGRIHRAPIATGTNADCARPVAHDGAVAIPRDRVLTLTVATGEVACLGTVEGKGYELLWHAFRRRRSPNCSPRPPGRPGVEH